MQSSSGTFHRAITLPRRPDRSFFLWGPRKAGKSFLLKSLYPRAHWIDLLKGEEFVRYSAEPWLLREEVSHRSSRLVVIDEVQKVPALLDEVHWLIENRGTVFVLSGSSARKLVRGKANLLGGRALRHELHGLVHPELGERFDLRRLLNHGTLPDHYLEEDVAPLLRAYVSDYLKEEIAAEGLVRNLATFASFLRVAALSDTEQVNFSNIARECGVSSQTVRAHFQILEDTLFGSFLPAYAKRPKRRTVHAPKFYFHDVAPVNLLCKRGAIEPGSELFGKALENLVHHELSAFRSYRMPDLDLRFWRLSSGAEVDFILGDMEVGIEVKATKRVLDHHMKGLRELRAEHPRVKRLILVSTEPRGRVTADSIRILPLEEFLRALWAGGVI